MVFNLLKGMGKANTPLADIKEDTKLTKEEFRELIANIDKGLRSLPATAQVCFSSHFHHLELPLAAWLSLSKVFAMLENKHARELFWRTGVCKPPSCIPYSCEQLQVVCLCEQM
jgi:hypothetical protein